GGARAPGRGLVLLHALVERVPLRADLHRGRRAADAARRALGVRRLRLRVLGPAHGGGRARVAAGRGRLHLPAQVHGGWAHGRRGQGLAGTIHEASVVARGAWPGGAPSFLAPAPGSTRLREEGRGTPGPPTRVSCAAREWVRLGDGP